MNQAVCLFCNARECTSAIAAEYCAPNVPVQDMWDDPRILTGSFAYQRVRTSSTTARLYRKCAPGTHFHLLTDRLDLEEWGPVEGPGGRTYLQHVWHDNSDVNLPWRLDSTELAGMAKGSHRLRSTKRSRGMEYVGPILASRSSIRIGPISSLAIRGALERQGNPTSTGMQLHSALMPASRTDCRSRSISSRQSSRIFRKEPSRYRWMGSVIREECQRIGCRSTLLRR